MFVTYNTVDARTEVKLFEVHVDGCRDKASLRDLQKFVLSKDGDDCSWLLDDQLHAFISSVLVSGQVEAKVRLVRLLAASAMKGSFINLLNLDRKLRCIMNYADSFDQASLDEQKAVALLMCNLFSNPATASYALYFSEWTTNASGRTTSNAQVLCHVGMECMRSLNPSLVQYGTGIMYNISCRDVRVMEKPKPNDRFGDASLDCDHVSHSTMSSEPNSRFVALKAYDDIVVDISSCVWEAMFTNKILNNQDHMWRCLTTLINFMHMLNVAKDGMADDLKSLLAKDDSKISQKNAQLIQTLIDLV